MTRRQYAGGAAATAITTPIASSGGGTVTLGTSTGWPDGAVGKFHVVIDPGNSSEEKILVDLRSGTTLSFSAGGRGADGTVSTSHAVGAQIWLCYTAVDADEANAHVNAVINAHAATAVTFTPTGNISATTVQAAIAEVDNETDTRLDTLETAGGGYAAADAALDARLDLVEADGWVTPVRYAPTLILQATGNAQPFSGGTTGFKTWNTEVADPLNMITVPSDTITISASAAGLIWVRAFATPASVPSSYCAVGVANLTTLESFTGGNHLWGNTFATGISIPLRVSTGDVLKVFVSNQSTGSINYTSALLMYRLAA